MSQQVASLGLPGDLIFPGSSIDEFTSHIGGHPHCPAGVDPPPETLLKCRICEDDLVAVLSQFLPRQDTSSTSRSLRIYGCTREGCGKDQGSWRALRCEWPEIAQPSSIVSGSGKSIAPSTKASNSFVLPPSNELSTDSWGLEAPTEGFGVGSSSTPAFDFGDLSAALDTMHKSNKTAAAAAKMTESFSLDTEPLTASADTPATNIETSKSAVPSAVPCLPSFYLIQTQEEAPRPPAITARERELMERYEREERMAPGGNQETTTSTASSSAPIEGSGSTTTAVEGSTWEGEGYEPDTVLVTGGRAAPGRTFLKFLKRLQAAPEQCTRRGGGDTPLWPSDAPLHQPTACTVCGAARNFEVQLMAPVIAALEESVEWLVSEGIDISIIKQPPTSWEWSTVIMYSCSARCCTGKWIEEELVVVGED